MKWPTLFDGVDSTTEDWIVDQMYIVSSNAIFLSHETIYIRTMTILNQLIILARESFVEKNILGN